LSQNSNYATGTLCCLTPNGHPEKTPETNLMIDRQDHDNKAADREHNKNAHLSSRRLGYGNGTKLGSSDATLREIRLGHRSSQDVPPVQRRIVRRHISANADAP
jgi:hypothetical protein